MRILFVLFLLLISANQLNAQKYYSSYQASLAYGEEFQSGELSVVIEEVTDSRCPKGVNCVRAGEAKVVIALLQNGKLLERKTLIFTAEGSISEKNNLIFSNTDIRLIGMALYPYPEGPNKIALEDYVLEIKVN